MEKGGGPHPQKDAIFSTGIVGRSEVSMEKEPERHRPAPQQPLIGAHITSFLNAIRAKKEDPIESTVEVGASEREW
jgi:hypothetical protein